VHVGLAQERQDFDVFKLHYVISLIDLFQPGLPDLVAVYERGERGKVRVSKRKRRQIRPISTIHHVPNVQLTVALRDMRKTHKVRGLKACKDFLAPQWSLEQEQMG
jgi:hypothetical protein